jgi:hypothetical protein
MNSMRVITSELPINETKKKSSDKNKEGMKEEKAVSEHKPSLDF